MKKLDFFKYAAAILAALILLSVAGCGDKDDENGGGNINVPKDPPAVDGADVLPTKGYGSGFANEAVRMDNKDDFISVFRYAINRSNSNSSAQRAAPDEYEKEYEKHEGSYTMYGDYDGYVEVTGKSDWEFSETATSTRETGYDSYTYKFSNFSNRNNLFLSGALGVLFVYDNKEKNVSNTTIKVNGTINFAGKYRGKVVFEKAVFTQKIESRYRQVYNQATGDYYNQLIYTDTLMSGITSGRFYVSSGGETPLNLPDNMFKNFSNPYSNDKDREYPNMEITANKMPAVPTAPNGNLTNRNGDPVSAENLINFFIVFKEENRRSRTGTGWRAKNETKEGWEILMHGKESGYYTEKWDGIYQQSSHGNYETATGTLKFDDYSNKGFLYCGGGFGMATLYNRNKSSNYERSEFKLNGKIKFNGLFKGELDFQNFSYMYEYTGRNNGNELTYDGSVKIGTLDVTEEYLRYMVKGEEPIIPQPEIGDNLLSDRWLPSWGNYVYGCGQINNFYRGENEISWDAFVPINGSSDCEEDWSGAVAGVFVGREFLDASKKITIKYSAGYIVLLTLVDRENDVPYIAILPPAQNREVTFDLSRSGGQWDEDDYNMSVPDSTGNHFRQPHWAGYSGGGELYELDLSKVDAIELKSFGTGEDVDANVRITKFVVE